MKKLARIVKTADGRYIILVNGFQWGGRYDRSGAGDATFPTRKAAIEAWVAMGYTLDTLDIEVEE
jgi:hypothetical protein